MQRKRKMIERSKTNKQKETPHPPKVRVGPRAQQVPTMARVEGAREATAVPLHAAALLHDRHLHCAPSFPRQPAVAAAAVVVRPLPGL